MGQSSPSLCSATRPRVRVSTAFLTRCPHPLPLRSTERPPAHRSPLLRRPQLRPTRVRPEASSGCTSRVRVADLLLLLLRLGRWSRLACSRQPLRRPEPVRGVVDLAAVDDGRAPVAVCVVRRARRPRGRPPAARGGDCAARARGRRPRAQQLALLCVPASALARSLRRRSAAGSCHAGRACAAAGRRCTVWSSSRRFEGRTGSTEVARPKVAASAFAKEGGHDPGGCSAADGVGAAGRASTARQAQPCVRPRPS